MWRYDVSRIGSNAQCKLMKLYVLGIKNLLTHYRSIDLSSNDTAMFSSYLKLLSLNLTFFQDHLLVSSIDHPLILLLAFRIGYLFNSIPQIYRILFILSTDFPYLYYLICLYLVAQEKYHWKEINYNNYIIRRDSNSKEGKDQRRSN